MFVAVHIVLRLVIVRQRSPFISNSEIGNSKIFRYRKCIAYTGTRIRASFICNFRLLKHCQYSATALYLRPTRAIRSGARKAYYARNMSVVVEHATSMLGRRTAWVAAPYSPSSTCPACMRHYVNINGLTRLFRPGKGESFNSGDRSSKLSLYHRAAGHRKSALI